MGVRTDHGMGGLEKWPPWIGSEGVETPVSLVPLVPTRREGTITARYSGALTKTLWSAFPRGAWELD